MEFTYCEVLNFGCVITAKHHNSELQGYYHSKKVLNFKWQLVTFLKQK